MDTTNGDWNIHRRMVGGGGGGQKEHAPGKWVLTLLYNALFVCVFAFQNGCAPPPPHPQAFIFVTTVWSVKKLYANATPTPLWKFRLCFKEKQNVSEKPLPHPHPAEILDPHITLQYRMLRDFPCIGF